MLRKPTLVLVMFLGMFFLVGCDSEKSQHPTDILPRDESDSGLTLENDLYINPPPPQNLKAAVIQNEVHLTWDPPPPVEVDHAYSDVISYYRAFRRCADEIESMLLGATEELNYIDTPIPECKAYYLVTAIHDDDMESARTSEVIVDYGKVVDDNIELPKPTAQDPLDKLSELRLEGGFAGFCDHLTVFADGHASLSSECTDEKSEFQVSEDLLGQLMAQISDFGSFTYEFEDNPGGADSLYTELKFYGQGTNEEPTQEQIDNLLKILNSILVQGKQ